MKASIAEETARIEDAIKALDAEKSSYADLMQQAEAEVISFEHAWREGGIHRKRELQNALFPEGLTWWIKRRVFETGKGLSMVAQSECACPCCQAPRTQAAKQPMLFVHPCCTNSGLRRTFPGGPGARESHRWRAQQTEYIRPLQ